MKHTLFFIFLLISTSAVAQYTAIPDINFEKTLISLGHDSGAPDGKVLTSSIKNITHLDVNHRSDQYNKINNLTGIQDFTSLTTLICYYNNLSTLDLSKNTLLTQLDCSTNLLTSLDVSKNTNLALFMCSYNKLTTLDISNNINLVHFFCEFNNLKSLDVTNNVKLMIFYAGYNQLNSLDVSKNINLRYFHCAYDYLTNLDVSKNINLVELGCINNLLTDLDLSKNTKLTYVGCKSNLLTNLNLKNGNNLNLTYNSIVSYNSDFKNNPNLICISVDDVAYSNANWSALKDATASYTTTENQAPEIRSPQTFCIANNQTLDDVTITSGTNLIWHSVPTGGNPLINNTLLIDGMTYYASQNSGGCENPRTPVKIFIGDSSAPIPALLNLPDINGDCKTIITTIPTATDACLGVITATTASPLSYSLPGTYIIDWKYDDGNGNSVLQNQTVIISPQPLPTATSPQPFCIQQNASLSSITITGQNIKWYDALTNGNFLPNTTVLQNGITYYASQTINGCESNRIAVNVIVTDNQPPVPNLTILPTIPGDCKTIITTIPTATDACAGLITATTASPLSYSIPGTYTIIWIYDDGYGNSVPQNQTVNISPQPLPTATSPQPFCIQQNASLCSITITGQNIKWYDVLTNGNLLANTTLLQNGITYYASQTINGCESERVPVLINIQNTLAPTGNLTQTFCSSQNPTLNTLVITGTAIKWYNTLGALLPSATPLQDGKTYYATQTLNGCESPIKLAVTVSLISTLPANNYDELFCDDLNDAKEIVNLSSYNSNVISNPNSYNFSYYNSISGAQNETATDKIANFTSYKLVLDVNKIYVRINSNTPCYAVAELKLTLISKPIIDIQDIVPICENNTITIDAGAGFDSYLWSNGDVNQTISVVNPGNYSVTVTDDYGTTSCSSTKNFEVKKSNKATINSIETKDWTTNENTIIVNITSSSKGDYEYSIDGENYQTSNQFTDLNSGKYTVLVRDKNGCGTTPPYEVYLLMYPKFFTPNGDGYNDTWKIKFSDIEEGLNVKIFDRYGKLIKALVNNADCWNGTFNGTNLPADDYWFIATRANGEEHKGHFSLKR